MMMTGSNLTTLYQRAFHITSCTLRRFGNLRYKITSWKNSPPVFVTTASARIVGTYLVTDSDDKDEI